MVAPPSVAARNLRKRYGDVVAVDGLDLEVERGTCLALLGPNGAGKTTTIEMLEGLKRPDEGSIEILGRRWDGDADAIRAAIGVQLQDTKLPEKLKVFEVLRLFAALYENARGVAELLELVGLVDKRDALVQELSGGQRQRLSLGCALAGRPEVLFLDEPTTGLDPQARRKVWETVEQFLAGGGSVLLTTHYMEEAERLASRLLVVDRGRAIARGTPRELVASLAADSILEFAVVGAQGEARGDAALAERIAKLPDVGSAKLSDTRVRVAAKSFERVLPALLALLQSEGLTLADLNVHRPTLEDVFVALTGRDLREA